jgi:hypothetical protein
MHLRLRFSNKKVILKFCLCLLYFIDISVSAESKSIKKKISYQAIDNKVDEESGIKHNQTNKPNISENTCNSFNQYSVSMTLVTKLDGSY